MDDPREEVPRGHLSRSSLRQEVEAMKRFRGWCGLLLVMVALGAGLSGGWAADKKDAEDKDPLAPLARFIGEWTVHGKWSSGEELQARSVYAWGLGKKIITAKTYVKNKDNVEYQRYEGVLAWHPRKKSLFEISFAFDGDVHEMALDVKDADTLLIGYRAFDEGDDPKVRQKLEFKGPDKFVWTVLLKADDGWQQLIEATWERKAK
jgi:hypothetical protein